MAIVAISLKKRLTSGTERREGEGGKQREARFAFRPVRSDENSGCADGADHLPT